MRIISILLCTLLIAMWALSGCTTAPAQRAPAGASARVLGVESVVGWKTTDDSGRDLGDSYTVTFRVLIDAEGRTCDEVARQYRVETDDMSADLDPVAISGDGKCAFHVQMGFPKGEGPCMSNSLRVLPASTRCRCGSRTSIFESWIDQRKGPFSNGTLAGIRYSLESTAHAHLRGGRHVGLASQPPARVQSTACRTRRAIGFF